MLHDEYKKAKEEKFRQTGRGFYQKEQQPPENKFEFKSMLACFARVSRKRHDATDATIRNQQAAISNINTQVDQLTKLVNKRLPPNNLDPKHNLTSWQFPLKKTASLSPC